MLNPLKLLTNPYAMAMNLPCEICLKTTHLVEEHQPTGLLICLHPDCVQVALLWHHDAMHKMFERGDIKVLDED